MRFDRFMEAALYHPDYGFYSRSPFRKIGRKGDFFTSVSVGALYGELLGMALEDRWAGRYGSGEAPPLVIVEQGAHDGQLALDVLEGFRRRQSPFWRQLEYRILEPDRRRREMLQVALKRGAGSLQARVRICASVESATTENGIFICNELLDAFPVRRFTWSSRGWLECYVIADTETGHLEQKLMPAGETDTDAGFSRFRKLIRPFEPFDEGYTTEFCPGLEGWTREIAGLFSREGDWWIIDYGLDARAYFDRARKRGTLRCFHRHRAHENPLWLPGECDITAQVNHTDLSGCAEAAGLSLVSITDQAAFLVDAGREWLLTMEGRDENDAPSRSLLRQFQMLTHPSLMGQVFQVAKFEKRQVKMA